MKVLLISIVLQINLLYAAEGTVNFDQNKSKETFRTLGIGIGRIELGDDFHKSLSIVSKIGYKYETFNIYLFRNSNMYKHLTQNHSLSIMGLGFNKNSCISDDITLGIGIGLGMNLLSSKLFSDFRKSFDFGFAYTLEINYALNSKWSALLTYNKYYLNTNTLQLTNIQPDILTFNIIYAFDM